MPKEAVFTMKLEPELRAEFMAEAEAAHRPASQILRELMREFVRRQREAREYDEFLRRKAEAGRMTMLKPSLPHGVPAWRVRREGRLDARGVSGPYRCVGLHRGR